VLSSCVSLLLTCILLFYISIAFCHVVTLVLSSNDDRLENARELLHQTLQDIKLKDAILLVCANKQDVVNAKTASKITDALELNKIQKRTWKLQATCAKTGEGLNEGFVWLSTELKNKKAKAAAK